MKPPSLLSRPAASRLIAFSLVEVTLALGIVSFGLVAILGVLPVALTASRTSIAQTHATGIMETVFAGLRAQPFTKATIGAGLIYPEADPAPAAPPAAFLVNLATRGSSAPGDTGFLLLFAVMTETAPSGSNDTRRLRFVATADDMKNLVSQSGGAATGYELVFGFNSQPEGMPIKGLANRVTLSVRAAVGTISKYSTTGPGYVTTGPGDVYNFVTVIANRGGN